MDNDVSLKNSIFITSGFVILLWWLKVCEVMFGWDLHLLGIYPQAPAGLIGIVTAPLIHGSWQHVTSNTLPLLLLGSILIYGYPKSRWWTLAIIWLLSGLGVWLFARQNYHFGASGLTHGMFFYLFFNGILRRDKRSIALLMVAFFMYGSMLLTIFPRDPGISYEYHFFGALGGALCAIGFRHWDPKPIQNVFPWESDSENNTVLEEEDPIIGEQWKAVAQNTPETSKGAKEPKSTEESK